MSATVDLSERLRAERERRGLSVQQAADDLRLDPRIIEALESGEFANVGAPVYAKGHLKKYAALLGIPNGDLAETIEQLDVPVPEPVNPEIATRIAAGARFGGRSSRRPVVGIALLAVLIVGVLWWKPWRLRFGDRSIVAVPRATAPAAVRPTRADGPPGAAAANPARPAGAPTPGVAVGPGPTVAAGSATSPTGAPIAGSAMPPASGTAVALQFTMAADCWADVHDASGAAVFQGIVRAGTSRTISGRAPFTVILGHAAGVALRVADRPVAIAPSFINGSVARFVVAADGAVSAVPAGPSQPPPP